MLSSLPRDLLTLEASKASIREVLGEPDISLPSLGRDKYGRSGGVATWRYRTGVLNRGLWDVTESLEIQFDKYGLRSWRIVVDD